MLTLVGCVELVKVIFQSLLLHSFKVYLWPKSLIALLHKGAKNFTLLDDYSKRKLALMS